LRKIILKLFAVTIIFSLVFGCSAPRNEADVEADISAEEISYEERIKMDLYISVLKGAFHEENGGDCFIAVKMDTLTGLSEIAKEKVLEELKGLAQNIYSYEDVKDDQTKFEFDAEGRMRSTIDGALLWLEVEEYSENKAIITGVSWFGNLGAVFPKYEANFKNGSWQLKLISMAVS
jgi:hypothetical protein